jgi:hypothetical protein
MIPVRSVGVRQRKVEMIFARIDESATGDDAILEGKYHLNFVKDGTGQYTLTLQNGASRRTIVVVGAVALTADLTPQILAVDTDSVQIEFANNAGAATNTDFHITLATFGSADEY